MEGFEFAELYRRAGQEVVEYRSSFWLKPNKFLLRALPTLKPIDLPRAFALGASLKGKTSIATFLSLSSTISEYNAAEYVYDSPKCDLEGFNSKARNQIRKGLKYCSIDRPSLGTIQHSGLEINRQVLARQNRSSFLAVRHQWFPYIDYLYHRNDVEILGAFVEGKMVAYVVLVKCNGGIQIYHPFMDRSYSTYNPVMALLYQGISIEFSKNGPSPVSYGLRSYHSMPSLDAFKRNMNFWPVPVKRAFVTRSWLTPFLGSPCSNAVDRILGQSFVPLQIAELYQVLCKGNQRN